MGTYDIQLFNSIPFNCSLGMLELPKNMRDKLQSFVKILCPNAKMLWYKNKRL